MCVLTAVVRRGVEGGNDLRIHLDQGLLRGFLLLVPLVNLFLHPVGELLFVEGGADIDDPAAGQLLELA